MSSDIPDWLADQVLQALADDLAAEHPGCTVSVERGPDLHAVSDVQPAAGEDLEDRAGVHDDPHGSG